MSISFNPQFQSNYSIQEILAPQVEKTAELLEMKQLNSVEEYMSQRADFFKSKDWEWVYEAVDSEGRPYVVFEGPGSQQIKLVAPNTRPEARQFYLSSLVEPEALLDQPLMVPAEVCPNPFVMENICTIRSLIGKEAGLGFGVTLLDQLTGTHYHYQLEAVEILTGINGITEIVIGSEKYALRRGDVLAIPPGAVYQMHGKSNARCLSLLFPAWSPEINFTLPEEECPSILPKEEKEVSVDDALHMKSWLNQEQIQGIQTDIIPKFLVKQEHNLGFELALIKESETQVKQNDEQAKILYSLGNAIVKMNGKNIQVKAGDVLMIPPNASYEINASAFLSLSLNEGK